MNIRFHNAVRNVTGTMHRLEVDGRTILLDCGLFQGRRQEAMERNSLLPFDAKTVDVMVLSHAHIDHSGNIPRLVRDGFGGRIFCTRATGDLVTVMLRDAAHIQEKDAEFMNKWNKRKNLPQVAPLYTMKDAERCMDRFTSIGYNEPTQITRDVRLTYIDAGHILGSAVVLLDVQRNGRSFRVAFTGDLGRKNLPVIRNPAPLDACDVFVTESTYGNKVHDSISDMKAELLDTVKSAIQRGGKVIVPSFSVGRTQELVYFLHELFNEGTLPHIPIFVDSPLSVNVTEVFRRHADCFDEETRKLFLSSDQDPFGFNLLRYVQNVEESKKLNEMMEPCVIISASGMAETGRILHHLANNISDPKNTVMIVSFMAEHTLGRRIVERAPEVKIFGLMVPLKARVVTLNGFSAHAGRDELLEYFGRLDRKRLQKVFIVHGESVQSEALLEGISQTGMKNALIPEEGKAYEL
jgi:metallo-beta-lactamase family protein